LQGTQLIGWIRVHVPVTVQGPHVYTLVFANADGAPDLQTQYTFDTRPASLFVLEPAPTPQDPTSDQWKLHFFGSLTSPSADPNADPDHDGVPNWAEYLAGTDPTDAHSYLHLSLTAAGQPAKGVALHWLSAPGKLYQIQTATSLSGSGWTVLAGNLAGDGTVQQFVPPNATSAVRFYRIAIQP
jgi:hypothetical protein